MFKSDIFLAFGTPTARFPVIPLPRQFDEKVIPYFSFFQNRLYYGKPPSGGTCDANSRVFAEPARLVPRILARPGAVGEQAGAGGPRLRPVCGQERPGAGGGRVRAGGAPRDVADRPGAALS